MEPLDRPGKRRQREAGPAARHDVFRWGEHLGQRVGINSDLNDVSGYSDDRSESCAVQITYSWHGIN